MVVVLSMSDLIPRDGKTNPEMDGFIATQFRLLQRSLSCFPQSMIIFQSDPYEMGYLPGTESYIAMKELIEHCMTFCRPRKTCIVPMESLLRDVDPLDPALPKPHEYPAPLKLDTRNAERLISNLYQLIQFSARMGYKSVCSASVREMYPEYCAKDEEILAEIRESPDLQERWSRMNAAYIKCKSESDRIERIVGSLTPVNPDQMVKDQQDPLFKKVGEIIESRQLTMGVMEAGAGVGVWLSDNKHISCLLYTSPSPRDRQKSRMPSSA